MNKRMKWTNEEINFIKEHYPLKGAKFCAYNLNRSIGSVRHVAMRNNIEFSTWSEEEIDILKNTYPIYGLCECAVLLKRNGNTIINKIKQLNIPLNTYRFNKNENEFLLKNYSLLGIKKCSEILNIPECKLSAKVRKLKLILNKNVRCEICKNTRYVKSNDEYNIHPQQFFDIKTPEVAYILGLLWADGYVSNIRSGIIAIAALEDDLETVKHIFLSTGKWNLNKRQLPNRRPQMTIQTTNKPLTTFLANNDYIVKSIASADKILSKIPNELQHYWFRGLIDGDGCFYINKQNGIYQFSLASSYGQDYKYIENVFNKLQIKYGICRRVQQQNGKEHKSSIIRISNRKDIIKFGNYIYNKFTNDNIGFVRKFKKFNEIKAMYDGQV